jgi:hypothetical protein
VVAGTSMPSTAGRRIAAATRPLIASTTLAFAFPGPCPKPLDTCTLVHLANVFVPVVEKMERKAAEAKPVARERPERIPGRFIFLIQMRYPL